MEFFATSNGIPVHISDSQRGEKCLILLHGYLETLYIYEEFTELLAPYFRVISVDLPGHGLTGSQPDLNTIDFAADVVSNVLDLCKVKSAVVAGHSMGGYVAQRAFLRYPEKFTDLILLNSTPFADSPEKKEERMREIDVINGGKLVQLASLSLPKMYAPQNLREFDEKIQETLEICETHDPNGIEACLRGMAERSDNTEQLKPFERVLMLFGDSDKFISVDKAAEISKLLPSAKSVVLPNCGHNSFVEQPQATLEAILNFCK